ncbi:MAG: hypothetical protein IT431_03750 [Phycisphaerales bacterium]|nr:hypothetical protein [Phycisphaerales bacterium]
MQGLGDLDGGSFRSGATAVSADGAVIVGTSAATGGDQSFHWTAAEGMVGLGRIDNNDITNRAYGVSWDGEVIVGEAYAPPRTGPYYWTSESGMRWLVDVLVENGVVVPDGWYLERAYAVSADGRTIVGYGLNPDGNTEGFVAYLGPACRADYNKDGSVTPDDVIAYLGAWAQRSIFADWNYDGLVNTRDVIAFLHEWVAKPGC